jgi:hypothetical protein
MASWLYLAADEYASGDATYDLAKNGFIPEVAAVQAYLQQGVFAVKQQRPLYDRADALVAGLSSLPYALPQIYQEVERLPRTAIRWLGNPGDDILEGRIAVVE